MRTSNEAIDLQKHMYDRDIDSRIKASRDDTLQIVRADIKALDAKVDRNFEVLTSEIKALDSKVDRNFEVLNTKIDVSVQRLEDKIGNFASMMKWVVGMLVTILLALIALAVPNIVSFFS